MTQIDTIPAEILLQVILLARNHARPPQRLAELRGVSKTWLQLIDSTSALWTTIDVSLQHGSLLNEAEVIFSLSRTSQAPLTVIFRDPDPSYIAQAGTYAKAQGALHTLVSSLALRTSILRLKHIDALSLLAHHAWPVLQDLNIHHLDRSTDVSDTCHNKLWGKVLKKAPHLVSVQLHERPYNLDTSITKMRDFPSHAVSQVNFHSTHKDLCTIVQQLPNLTHLNVRVIACPADPNPCLAAHRVTHATVEACGTLTNLLSGIHFPRLHTLNLSLTDPWNDGSEPFTPQQLPALQAVTLEWTSTTLGSKHRPAYEILKSLPPIKRLAFIHHRGASRTNMPSEIEEQWGIPPDSPRPIFWTRPCDGNRCDRVSLCDEFIERLPRYLPVSVESLEFQSVCLSTAGLDRFLASVHGTDLRSLRIGWRASQRPIEPHVVQRLAQKWGVRITVETYAFTPRAETPSGWQHVVY